MPRSTSCLEAWWKSWSVKRKVTATFAPDHREIKKPGVSPVFYALKNHPIAFASQPVRPVRPSRYAARAVPVGPERHLLHAVRRFHRPHSPPQGRPPANPGQSMKAGRPAAPRLSGTNTAGARLLAAP